MTISQGLILVHYGSKETGVVRKKWFRVSRRKWSSMVNYFSRANDFYYAKVFEYHRTGKKQGYIGQKIGFIYLKDGVIIDKIEKHV